MIVYGYFGLFVGKNVKIEIIEDICKLNIIVLVVEK